MNVAEIPYISLFAGVAGLDLSIRVALPNARCTHFAREEGGIDMPVKPFSEFTDAGLRSAAQRAFPLNPQQSCGACGITGVRLDRHHPDLRNDPLRVEILCRKCHGKADIRDGKRRSVSKQSCVICGSEFKPKRSRRGKLCGRAECLKECGRRAADARWASLAGSRTDQLRACGNGVVAVQGAAAFVSLARRAGLRL